MNFFFVRKYNYSKKQYVNKINLIVGTLHKSEKFLRNYKENLILIKQKKIKSQPAIENVQEKLIKEKIITSEILSKNSLNFGLINDYIDNSDENFSVKVNKNSITPKNLTQLNNVSISKSQILKKCTDDKKRKISLWQDIDDNILPGVIKFPKRDVFKKKSTIKLTNEEIKKNYNEEAKKEQIKHIKVDFEDERESYLKIFKSKPPIEEEKTENILMQFDMMKSFKNYFPHNNAEAVIKKFRFLSSSFNIVKPKLL